MTGGPAAATPCIWSGSANCRDGQIDPEDAERAAGREPVAAVDHLPQRARELREQVPRAHDVVVPAVGDHQQVGDARIGGERACRGVVPVNAAVGPEQDLGAGESEEVGHGR